MHKKGYIVTVRQNGETIQEVDGKIPVKFHSEYQIRLRNKTRKRAVADVYIDGRKAAEGIVVNANDYVDLERFVEKDLNKGERFKFVPLESNKVEDKGEPDNGNIEVKFYPEKDPDPIKISEIHEIHHHHHDHKHWCWSCGAWHYDCDPCWPRPYGHHHWHDTWSSSARIGGAAFGASSENISLSSNVLRGKEVKYAASLESSLSADTPIMANLNQASFSAGATAKGSMSNQKFSVTQVEVDKSNPVIIQVKLIGFGEKAEPIKIKASPAAIALGESILHEAGYCPTCGTMIPSTTDKFCRVCGTQLKD